MPCGGSSVSHPLCLWQVTHTTPCHQHFLPTYRGRIIPVIIIHVVGWLYTRLDGIRPNAGIHELLFRNMFHLHGSRSRWRVNLDRYMDSFLPSFLPSIYNRSMYAYTVAVGEVHLHGCPAGLAGVGHGH